MTDDKIPVIATTNSSSIKIGKPRDFPNIALITSFFFLLERRKVLQIIKKKMRLLVSVVRRRHLRYEDPREKI